MKALVAPVAATAVLLAASSAAAQQGRGALTGAALSAMTINSTVEPAISGTVGYRMNRVMSLGVELTVVPTLEPQLPDADPITIAGPGILIFPPPVISYDAVGGHAAIFTTNVRVDLPASRRLTPYVVGGGGVASIREKLAVSVDYPIPVEPLAGLPPGLDAVSRVPPASTRTSEVTTTDLALTLGGGLAIDLTDELALELDLRYLSLTGTRDRNIGRFGAGVSYRWR